MDKQQMPGMTSVKNMSQPIDIYLEEWINKSLDCDPNLAKKVNFVCQINISRNGSTFSSWILDLTSGKGSIYRKPNQEVNCSITLDENDLMKALGDKSHWRTLFIQRKLGLKGSRIALEKMQQFWIEADNAHKDKPISQSNTDQNRAILNSIITNGYKSDIIFYTLQNRMHEEADIVKRLSGIMQFDITKGNDKSIWTIDFTVPLGQNIHPGPPNGKPICILTMADEDFAKMMVNKFNPQKAFMMGKLKIKGQMLAIYKLFTVWIDTAFKKNKAPELPFISEIIFTSDLIPGLKSEIMVFQAIQRLVKLPQLGRDPGGVYYFEIRKSGQTVSKWKLDFTINKDCGIFSRFPIHNESLTENLIIIDDEDFALLVLNKLNIKQAMMSSRIKGDPELAPKLTAIFQTPIIKSKL